VTENARRTLRTPIRVAWVVLAGLAASLIVSTPARADTGTPPPYRATFGGPGHAEIYPSGLEVAPDGTIVVADTGNDMVKKYTAAGALVWAKGTSGNGAGQFGNPRDVGIDSQGNVFVADTENYRIVKLDSDGNWIKTIQYAGAGDYLGSPIGITVKNDLVYVADEGRKKVRIYDTNGTHLRSFTGDGSCVFAPIRDVDADDAGNVYVANYTNHNILKLTSTGGCITLWGTKGTGDGQFDSPYGIRVAHDPVTGQQLVYVADSNNGRLQVFDTDGNFVGKAGALGQPGDPGTFAHLRRVAVASDGDVWGADLWGWRLERFDRTATGWDYAQTIGGGAPPLTDAAVFHENRGIATALDGTVAVADTVHHRIVRMTANGQVLNACGQRGYGNGEYNWPRGVAIDQSTGEIWVADTKQSRLQVIKPDCSFVKVWGFPGSGTYNLNWPMAVTIRQTDRFAFVVDTRNSRIKSYRVSNKSYVANYGALGSGSGQFNNPRGIAVSPVNGHIFVADTGNNRVVELATTNASSYTWVRTYTDGFSGPEGVAVDSTGRIYVSDTANNRVVALDASGSETATFSDPDGLDRPTALAVGHDDRLYVADTYHDRMQVYSYGELRPAPAQQPTYKGDLAGPGLADTYGVDVATTPAAYYVVDPGRYSLLKIDRASGQVVAEVGGHQGAGNDEFAAARNVATDAAGNVYVADTPNQRIKKYDADLNLIATWGTKGSGDGQFTDPYAVAVGPGRGQGGAVGEVVYVVDNQNGGTTTRVEKFALDGTYVGQFANGELKQPRGIAVDRVSRRVVVLDSGRRLVRSYDENGTFLRNIGGGGSGPCRFTDDPDGIDISPDGTRLIASDDGGRRLNVWSWPATNTAPACLSAIGSGGSGPDQFDEVRGVEVTGDNRIVAADEFDHSLKEFQTDGTFVRELLGGGAPVGGVASPRGLAVDSAGHIFESDWWNQRIQRWNSDGSGALAWGFRGTTAEPGSVNFAWDVAIQPGTDRVFLVNRESHEIEVFTTDGTYVTRWGTRGSANGQFQFPQSAAFAPDGSLLVVDTKNNRIQRFSIDAGGNGTFVAAYGSYGNWQSAAGYFNQPTGISVASDGTIWVADTLNNRIEKRAPNGTWTLYKRPNGGANFVLPLGVTVAPDGAIWVADSGSDRIVKMDVNANPYYVLDGPALGISPLDAPFEVAFGTDGSAYVSDLWNNRIIKLGW